MTIRYTAKSNNNSQAVFVEYRRELMIASGKPFLAIKSTWLFHPAYRHTSTGKNQVAFRDEDGAWNVYGRLCRKIEATGAY